MKKFLICFYVIGSTVYGATATETELARQMLGRMAVAAGGAGIEEGVTEEVTIVRRKKISCTKKSAPKPTRYTLNRLAADYTLNVKYTNAIETDEIIFSLNNADSLRRVDNVWKYCKADAYKNHMLAGGIIIYEDGGELYFNYRPFRTDMFGDLMMPGHPTDEDPKIDWISNLSGTDHTDSLYRRKSITGAGTTNAGHSELQWIEDYQALWAANHDAIVRRFIPPVSTTKVYMSGIELDSSLDVCDGCLKDLIAFRTNAHGQQGLSAAIQAELERRHIHFFPGSPEAFGLLFYHSKVPYSTDAIYHAHSDAVTRQLRYQYGGDGGKRFFDLEEVPTPFVADDILAQHSTTNVEANIIYGHMHTLTDLNMLHSAAHRAFKL